MVRSLVDSISTRADSHVVANQSIVDLWGGMQGDIIIIHSAWNATRALQNIDIEKHDTILGHSLKDLGITSDHVSKIVGNMTRYGNLLIEGDMIAVDHILSLLRLLYDPNMITVKNSWELGGDENEIKMHPLFERIQNSNLVLICGPLANLVTSICLQEANLCWLVDSSDTIKMVTHPVRKKAKVLTPRYNTHKGLQCDIGTFLRCKNPFNSQKRMYVAMGTHAYGTQGAAALACNNKSAHELLSVPVDPYLENYNIDCIAWINVWKAVTIQKRENNKNTLGHFTDPSLRYQIHYPLVDDVKFHVHRNPSLIRSTQSTLRSGIFRLILDRNAYSLKIEMILDVLFALIGLIGGMLLILTGILKDVVYYGFVGVFLAVLSLFHASWIIKNGNR